MSVVVPNFNHGRYLPNCLGGILAQEPPVDELIVIDDASTDESIDVIEAFSARHPQIRLIRHTQNKGVIASLNEGLVEARGDWILCAAADDWILPGLVAASLPLLQAHPEAGLCSALTLLADGDIPSEPVPFPTALVLNQPGYIPPAQARKLLNRVSGWANGNTTILNRKFAIGAGGFRAELDSYTDGFLYQLLARRHGACFVPRLLGVWRRFSDGFASSSLASFERMGAIEQASLALMKGAFADAFEAEAIARWCRRWRYATSIGYVASGARSVQPLLTLIPRANNVDRIVLPILSSLPGALRRLLLAHMFLRLRPFDVTEALLRRVRWKLHGRRLV